MMNRSMLYDFHSEKFDDDDNVYLWYLRESDEFRVAVANYLGLLQQVSGAFATNHLRWLVNNKHFSDHSNFGKPEMESDSL